MGRCDRIAEPWGTRTPYGPGERWPTPVDSFLVAQALKDDELLGLTKECHPQTLRQLRWSNAALKEKRHRSW
jgi:hypothetical protein